MATYFISDTHFGHAKIIEFDATRPFRPFANIEEHNRELVRRWNETVRSKDVVFHLGDFCFGKQNLEIAGELNGDKRLVMGNHDAYPTADYLRYFTKVYGVCEYKGAVLSHVPVHQSQLERWRFNVHGHLHANDIGMSYKYVNVSCEAVDCRPIAWEEVLRRARQPAPPGVRSTHDRDT